MKKELKAALSPEATGGDGRVTFTKLCSGLSEWGYWKSSSDDAASGSYVPAADYDALVRESPASPWRHLDTEKPEDGQWCLVYERVGERTRYDVQMFLDGRFLNVAAYAVSVIAWLPLPAPPAKEDENGN